MGGGHGGGSQYCYKHGCAGKWSAQGLRREIRRSRRDLTICARGVGAMPANTIKKENVPRVPEELGGQVVLMEEKNQADHDISRS